MDKVQEFYDKMANTPKSGVWGHLLGVVEELVGRIVYLEQNVPNSKPQVAPPVIQPLAQQFTPASTSTAPAAEVKWFPIGPEPLAIVEGL